MDGDFWAQGAPIWNLLSAVVGGLIATGAGLLAEWVRSRSTTRHNHQTFLRDMYKRVSVAVMDLVKTGGAMAVQPKGTPEREEAFEDYQTATMAVNVITTDVRMFGSPEANSALIALIGSIGEATYAGSERQEGFSHPAWKKVGEARLAFANSVRHEIGLPLLPGQPPLDTPQPDHEWRSPGGA